MKKFFLEFVVFICGAIVMAYEITGSRILGPYVGTSMFVWSSIIGIILLSLSFGYYFGGKIADKRPNYKILSLIIGLSGIFIFLSILFKNQLLEYLVQSIHSIPVISIIASLLLFTIPAILLGMVSPFAARLKIKATNTVGSTVGYLYALSTLGSITGTFLAGFYLIPGYRLSNILLILSLVLIMSAIGLFLVYNNKKHLQTSSITKHE